MNYELAQLSTLHADPANANCHDETDIVGIMAKLATFTQVEPLVVQRKTRKVIGGNGRLEAMRRLGWTECEVNFVDCDNVTATAMGIALNTRKSKFDETILAEQIAALRSEEFDLTAIGLDEVEIGALLDEAVPDVGDDSHDGGSDAEDPGAQIDKAEELRGKWKTESGQLWRIGKHRMLCGDSTKSEDVARVMGGEKANLCFTSPPYGQQRDYKASVSDWDTLMNGVFVNLPMADDGQVLVNLGMIHRDGEWLPYWDGWIERMRGWGWRRFGWYVWDQGAAIPGDWNGRYGPSHEFVFHFNRVSIRPQKTIETLPTSLKRAELKQRNAANGKIDGALRGVDGKIKPCHSVELYGQPFKIPDSVIRISREKARSIHTECHPAVFPPALPLFVMESWPGLVYEPFCGSGTTIVAAEQTNRICYGIEISPAYCAVILERLAGLGLEPELMS